MTSNLSRINLRTILVVIGVGLYSVGVLAEPVARPRVALVLGGGGARGSAHIGVLQVLEENRIPVDCIAGTSMGALVSGAFASGLKPDEMLTMLDQADWHKMFKDNPEAEDIKPRMRAISRRYLPGSELGISDKGVQAIPGMVDGQKIKLFINRIIRSSRGEPQIEDLKLPTVLIATDLVSGKKFAFRKGDLSTAMRASMSVPGVMAPVEVGKNRLVDGGLVDNVPIEEARALCQADVVIAVNVGSPLLKEEDIGGLMSVTAQMVNLLTEQNVQRSLAALKPNDIYMQPELGDLSAGAFDRYREAAKIGRAAAEASLPKLRALSVDQSQYQKWWQAVAGQPVEPPKVDKVEVAELKHVNPKFIERHLDDYTGKPVDPDQINTAVMKIYGDGDYQSVDYSLRSAHERKILRITPVEKSWGPDYLRLGLNIDGAAQRGTDFNLRVAYHKTWLNDLGGEWIGGVQVGSESRLFTEFYQPLDIQQRFFIEPKLGLRRESIPIYQDNHRLQQYFVTEARGDLMAGINVGSWGPISTGWSQLQRKNQTDVGDPDAPELDAHYGGWLTSIAWDQQDNLFIPSRGWALQASYFDVNQEHYSKAMMDTAASMNWGNYVIHGRLIAAGSPQGQLPIYDPAALGGFLRLSGFDKDQIKGDSVRFGSVRVEKVIGQLPIGLRGDMRLGLSLERGRVDGRYTETNLNGWQESYALYLGGETPIGPTYLGFGHSPHGMSNLFVFVGTP